MKYLKLFEIYYDNANINSYEDFLKRFEEFKNKNFSGFDNFEHLAKNFGIPVDFYDEYILLSYLYVPVPPYSFIKYGWYAKDKRTYNSIKRKVKQQVTKSIIEKINNNTKLYFELKEIFDKKRDYPLILPEKWIYIIFITSLRKTWIANAENEMDKYNM